MGEIIWLFFFKYILIPIVRRVSIHKTTIEKQSKSDVPPNSTKARWIIQMINEKRAKTTKKNENKNKYYLWEKNENKRKNKITTSYCIRVYTTLPFGQAHDISIVMKKNIRARKFRHNIAKLNQGSRFNI